MLFRPFFSNAAIHRVLEANLYPSTTIIFPLPFSNMDNISIWSNPTLPPNTTVPDRELVPFSIPRLRGGLMLREFDSVETWTSLITSCGGLRFRYMDLWKVGGCASVLFEACAETLETLGLYAAGGIGEQSSMGLSADAS